MKNNLFMVITHIGQTNTVFNTDAEPVEEVKVCHIFTVKSAH